MYGVINKQHLMQQLFESLEHVKEVYVDEHFDLSDDTAQFTLLCSHEIATHKVLYSLQKLFTGTVRVYVVYDAYSALLRDKRIMWREGVWYL